MNMLAVNLKKMAAEAVLQYLPSEGVIGIGTGSTVKYFIEALAASPFKNKIEGAVPSSNDTQQKLKEYSIPIVDLNSAGSISVYIDGTDSVNQYFHLLKGGGGALTREKIIACASQKFICIAEQSKYVPLLNCEKIPLVIEVIPMARSYVAREIVKLKGAPVYREGFVSDNGNIILDVYQLDLTEPLKMEEKINNITGVVCHGLFVKRRPDILLLANSEGIKTQKLVDI